MADITPQTQINIRVGELANDLKTRGAGEDGMPMSEIVRRDLERYYYHLRLALAQIEPAFTLNEAQLLCDVLNGTRVEPVSAGMLWAEVADSEEDGYGAKWKVDVPAFAQRLREMPPFTMLAICDAVERFWQRGGSVEGALFRSGLIRQ